MTCPASLTALLTSYLSVRSPVNIDEIYRQESGRILAALTRLLGSFDVAEEAAQEPFAVALQRWPETKVPANPRAWLVSTARGAPAIIPT